MALSVLATCALASDEAGVSSVATFLTVLFSAYVALDSVLASIIVTRKAGEAERVALASQQGE